MNTVYAGQHLYANVEQEQSPQRRGGFQTLFATRTALTAADIDDIEGRLVYHRGPDAPIKRLYFTTSSGKHVVAQIVPLTDTDRLGRQGRYLAHSLVFSPETFHQLGAQPFPILQQVSWCTSVEEALQHGDQQTGEMPPLAVSLRESSPPRRLASWPIPALQQWTLLALRAQRLAQQRQTVVVVGTSEDIAEALDLAYLAVPMALRPHCTFDTYFYRCNLVATYYWAIGESTQSGQATAPCLDTQTHTVLVSPPGQAETAYERWVVAMLEQQDSDHIARCKDHAYALCTWLEASAARPPGSHGSPVLSGPEALVDAALLDTVPPEVLTSVFTVNALQVQAALSHALRTYLHVRLVRRLQPAILRNFSASDLFTHLRQGFAASQLLEALYQAYLAQPAPAPSRTEQRALRTLLEHHEHQGLALLLACWAKQPSVLQQALAQLSMADYRDFVRLARRTGLTSPLALLIPGRGEVFVDTAVDAELLRRPGLFAVTRGLLAAGESRSLAHLVPYVAQATPQEIRALVHLIAAHPDVPRQFCDTVHSVHQSLPPLRGVQAWLGKLMCRRS